MARKNKYIKSAHQEVEITNEQMMEIRRCMTDPIYFCKKYVKIIHPKHGAMSLDLYDYQETMINLYQDNERVIVMSARQTGKSVVAAAYIGWFNFFHFDKTTLIVSNHNANSMEMVARIRDIYENLPDWLKPGADPDAFNKHELTFDNGCRIVSQATTANSGRGLSISLLYCDELAFVNQRIQTEFWSSITPTLSTGGSAIITSTPNGDQGLFAELWRGSEMGNNEFKSLYVPWDAPPERDEAFKIKMIGEVGEQKWKQEFECQFISSDALLISSMFMQQVTQEIKKYPMIRDVKNVKFWHDIVQDGTYIVGVDPATGGGEDYSVIEVFKFPEMVQIAEYRSNTMSTVELYGILKNLLNYILSKNCQVYYSIENNGVGQGIIALYENDENPPECEFVEDGTSKSRGMVTTSKSKMASCVTFKQMFETLGMQIRSPTLLSELKSFARHKGSYAAQPGASDDCVSALLIVIRILQELATFDDEAFAKLYAGNFGRITKSEWEANTDTGDYDEDNDIDIGVMIV